MVNGHKNPVGSPYQSAYSRLGSVGLRQIPLKFTTKPSTFKRTPVPLALRILLTSRSFTIQSNLSDPGSIQYTFKQHPQYRGIAFLKQYSLNGLGEVGWYFGCIHGLNIDHRNYRWTILGEVPLNS